MKAFMFRTVLFVLPFMVVYILNIYVYSQNDGDLARIGYLYKNPSPKSRIMASYSLNKAYTVVSELDLSEQNKFGVLTIGDSFAEQDSLGYKNYLAHQDIAVLHVNRYLSGDNPAQRLVELLNGGFFDHVQIGTVILESAERLFVQRCEHIDFSRSIGMDSLHSMIHASRENEVRGHVDFFSDAMIKIPWTNVQYLYRPKPTYSKTYKVAATSDQLFSNEPTNVLFSYVDLSSLKFKNDSTKIAACNRNLDQLNKMLAERHIELIVMVCPDKYDMYYPYIRDNGDWEEPKFFSLFTPLPKRYHYLDAYSMLSSKLPTEKDVYYYDDTHWSPKSAAWVGIELAEMVKESGGPPTDASGH